MNYASRLGLVHFMRRDPNGIRRDPRRARGKNQLFPLTSCKTDGIRCRIRRDPRWRDIMNYAFSLGFGAFYATGSSRDPTGSALGRAWNRALRLGSVHVTNGIRRDPR